MRERRFQALDSLRGLAAILVFTCHYYDPPHHRTGGSFIDHGYLAVDFFFTLSGFIIATLYWDRIVDAPSLRRFFALRLGRLYPLHMVTALASIPICHFWPYASWHYRWPFTTPSAILHALLLQVFAKQHTWNGVSWSISTEWLAYVAFALFVLVIKRRDVLIAVFGVLLIGCSFDWFALTNNADPRALLRCELGFSGGMLVSRLPRAERPYWIASALEAAALALVIYAITGPNEAVLSRTFSRALIPLSFLAVVYVFAHDDGFFSDVLASQPFTWLGEVSYSVYMTHCWVLQVAPLTWSPLIVLPIVLVVSAVTYYCVEAPARAWSRRRVELSDSDGRVAAVMVTEEQCRS